MNYYEVKFTYTSEIETEVINDVLASELGEIGFESFTEDEDGLKAYIAEDLFDEDALSRKLAVFPLQNVCFHFTKLWIEGKDWNEDTYRARMLDTRLVPPRRTGLYL